MKRLAIMLALVAALALVLPAAASAAADDWFPGVTIPNGGNFSGTLNGGTDILDVYKVTIPAGQQVAFSLSGDAPGAFLWLFKPGSTNITDANEVTMSDEPDTGYYPQLLRQRDLLGGGTYYLLVAWDFNQPKRTVRYSVQCNRPTWSVRNDLPGETLVPETPVTGSLEQIDNWLEAYTVRAVEPGSGIHLQVNDRASACYDWGVVTGGQSVYSDSNDYLPILSFDSDVDDAANVATSCVSFQMPTSFATPTDLGIYLWLHRGADPYTMNVKITPPVTLEATQSATTIDYGKTVSFTSALSSSGLPMDAAAVKLERKISSDGSSLRHWNIDRSAITSVDGTAAAMSSASLTKNATMRVRYPGEFWTSSPAFKLFSVKVRPYLGSARPTSTAYGYRTFTATGSLKPQHTSGKGAVSIRVYKKSGSKYYYKKTVTGLGASSYRYSVRLNLPRGSYMLVTTHNADSANAAKTGAPSYFTVR